MNSKNFENYKANLTVLAKANDEDLENLFIISGIIKAAYTVYDFMDETIWLDMLRARNDMTHIYDGEAAKQLVQDILTRYIPEFTRLMEGIRQLYEIQIHWLHL